jgi:hypothetical protein
VRLHLSHVSPFSSSPVVEQPAGASAAHVSKEDGGKVAVSTVPSTTVEVTIPPVRGRKRSVRDRARSWMDCFFSLLSYFWTTECIGRQHNHRGCRLLVQRSKQCKPHISLFFSPAVPLPVLVSAHPSPPSSLFVRRWPHHLIRF